MTALKSTIRFVSGLAISGLAIFLVAACAPAPEPPPPTVVNLSLAAGSNINQNAQGQATPVLVRVYQLRSPTAFESADYFQLVENEQSVLGADLAARDDVTLAPGTAKTLSLTPNADVRFIGVAAAFREIDRADWREVIPVPANQTTDVTVAITGLSVAAQGAGGGGSS